ncbi:hypothetical protein BU26DRAFT_562470 [Trematosphaeria pertusa]|uniref:Uncharacterized protein n=1 Tax=Trematosphaeria pertusa TaxID=390896 RepID=A0A6A6IJD5_9PLEO|nr:uncharacterized protein BU26DRAFT_562470 [Trematosphaeria pertusa]KAF2250486.1 hypothetical protein BU26DRAFT_562470 [Trematosphaeria pertusa]
MDRRDAHAQARLDEADAQRREAIAVAHQQQRLTQHQHQAQGIQHPQVLGQPFNYSNEQLSIQSAYGTPLAEANYAAVPAAQYLSPFQGHVQQPSQGQQYFPGTAAQFNPGLYPHQAAASCSCGCGAVAAPTINPHQLHPGAGSFNAALLQQPYQLSAFSVPTTAPGVPAVAPAPAQTFAADNLAHLHARRAAHLQRLSRASASHRVVAPSATAVTNGTNPNRVQNNQNLPSATAAAPPTMKEVLEYRARNEGPDNKAFNRTVERKLRVEAWLQTGKDSTRRRGCSPSSSTPGPKPVKRVVKKQEASSSPAAGRIMRSGLRSQSAAVKEKEVSPPPLLIDFEEGSSTIKEPTPEVDSEGRIRS